MAALTPVCVAQFRSVAEAARTTHLAALEEESSWQQPDYVVEQGWATMPGAEEANEEVAYRRLHLAAQCRQRAEGGAATTRH